MRERPGLTPRKGFNMQLHHILITFATLLLTGGWIWDFQSAIRDRFTIYTTWITLFYAVSVILHETGIW